MRRLARPRLYEILLLADVAVVAFLLRTRARMNVDPLRTLLDMRQSVTVLGVVLLAGILVRALVAARRGPRRAFVRARAFLRPRAAADLVRLLTVLVLVSWAYSWLKVALPLLRPDVLFDPGLFRIETALHFGVNPGRLLQGLFPYPSLWRALDGFYGAFLWTVMAAVAWFGAALTLRERARFAAGFTFLWVFGAWFYVAVPSLGPCFVLKDDYTEVRAAMPSQSATMDLLFAHYGRIRALHRHPEGADISPYLGVAAMPSLHVGAQAFFMFFARRRSKTLFAVFAVLTAITFFTSVVSGWHYAIDGYAAVLLAWLCEVAGRRSVPPA